MSTIILTATIDPKQTPFVKIRDPKTRLTDYICSLLSWLNDSKAKEFIFCDNSGIKLDWSCINDMAAALNKKIEWLSFEGNSLSQILGKGWGEGEILEYAIQNSHILKNHSHFYKTTGRIFIPDFDHLDSTIKEDNVFWNLGGNKVQTIFFKCSLSFFNEKLLSIYNKCSDRQGVYLEHVYHDAVSNICKNNLPPLKYRGRSATNGGFYNSFYEEGLTDIAESLAIKILS